MCLTIRNFRTRKEAREFIKNPKIAEKDITVYKCISKLGVSPYYNFKYEKGFHYYQTGKPFTFVNYRPWYDSNWRVEINEGLHSCKSRIEALSHSGEIVKMIIPKGALYFENKDNYVSSELIYP